MSRATWSDIAADLLLAEQAARRAAQRHAMPAASPDAAEDRELAIGKHLHDAYCAAEKALERMILEVDGELPKGGSFHRDLLDRAARALPGIRDPLITAQTRDALRQLLGFRHVFRNQYGGFVFALAEPNIALADATMPRLSAEMAGAAQALRFLER